MRLRMDNDALAAEFFEQTRLLGIVAPMKDYQFCWQLNQMLQMDFRLNHDIEIQLSKKQRKYFFSIYEYSEPNGSLKHYLYNNQHEGEYLLPEFKHLDFLWLLKGDQVREEDVQQLQQSVKSIHAVQLVLELAGEKIRHKGHLIF